MKDYLPIGTIVKIEGNKRMMILGYNYKQNDYIYDYIGCNYDMKSNDKEKLVFQRAHIKEIVFVGYETDKSNKYLKLVDKIKDEFEKGLSAHELLKRTIVTVEEM